MARAGDEDLGHVRVRVFVIASMKTAEAPPVRRFCATTVAVAPERYRSSTSRTRYNREHSFRPSNNWSARTQLSLQAHIYEEPRGVVVTASATRWSLLHLALE